MSLHGTIMANELVRVYWEARRVGELTHWKNEHRYECLVDVPDPPQRYKFEVVHRYSDGAIALAAKVLQEALRRLG